MNKKGAALLIGLLIIAVGGTVALIAAKAVITGTYSASRISDSMIAEEASQAGLEYGLYQCKSAAVSTTPTSSMIDLNISTDPQPHRYADISFPTFSDTIEPANPPLDPTPTVTRNCTIQSIGRYGKVYKKHTLNITLPPFEQT